MVELSGMICTPFELHNSFVSTVGICYMVFNMELSIGLSLHPHSINTWFESSVSTVLYSYICPYVSTPRQVRYYTGEYSRTVERACPALPCGGPSFRYIYPTRCGEVRFWNRTIGAARCSAVRFKNERCGPVV